MAGIWKGRGREFGHKEEDKEAFVFAIPHTNYVCKNNANNTTVNVYAVKYVWLQCTYSSCVSRTFSLCFPKTGTLSKGTIKMFKSSCPLKEESCNNPCKDACWVIKSTVNPLKPLLKESLNESLIHPNMAQQSFVPITIIIFSRTTWRKIGPRTAGFQCHTIQNRSK